MGQGRSLAPLPLTVGGGRGGTLVTRVPSFTLWILGPRVMERQQGFGWRSATNPNPHQTCAPLSRTPSHKPKRQNGCQVSTW